MKRSRATAPPYGFSLMEVVVSLLILVVGVTSVIALFPVATARIRTATLDTRSTMEALSTWNVIDIKDMLNDPLLYDPTPPQSMAPTNDQNFLQDPFTRPIGPMPQAADSYFFWIPGGTAAATYQLQRDCDSGLPLLIDPMWVHFENQAAINTNGDETDVGPPPAVDSRQSFIDMSDASGLLMGNQTVSPTNALNVRVCTTWEAASISTDVDSYKVREAYIRRWFTSPGDIKYREEMAGMPFVPADGDVDDPGADFPLPFADTSAERTYPYSWALMIQSDVDPGTGAMTTDPPQLGAIPVPADRQWVLIFYKRNLANPTQTAIASFVNGDPLVTLRYASGQKPDMRRGMWLCELTVEDNQPSVPPNDLHRRSVQFHRVADFDDAFDGDEAVISVTLENAPSGYDNNGERGGPNPGDYENTDLNEPYPDDAPGSTSTPAYYPVVIFDGLIEVFGRPVD